MGAESTPSPASVSQMWAHRCPPATASRSATKLGGNRFYAHSHFLGSGSSPYDEGVVKGPRAEIWRMTGWIGCYRFCSSAVSDTPPNQRNTDLRVFAPPRKLKRALGMIPTPLPPFPYHRHSISNLVPVSKKSALVLHQINLNFRLRQATIVGGRDQLDRAAISNLFLLRTLSVAIASAPSRAPRAARDSMAGVAAPRAFQVLDRS